MSLFFFTYLSIYGLWHYYGWRKTRSILHVTRPKRLAAGGVSLFMIAGPILVRVLERMEFETPARLLAMVTYSWMGLLFVGVCLFFSVDCVQFMIRLAGLAVRKKIAPFPARPVFFSVVTLAALAMGYGYFEARALRVEYLVLGSPKISKTTGPVRIVQISDVHLGLMVGEKRLAAILDAVARQSPDLLVVTGDLVDGQADGLAGLAEMFHEIRPRLGKFAVTGNHEYYVGLDHAVAFIEQAGFTLLRNRTEKIADDVVLAGVDDEAGQRIAAEGAVDVARLIADEKNRYTVLLKHRPLVIAGSEHLPDLQLSGHTHQGQIFPFVFATRLRFPFASGLNVLPGGACLYVNRGAGTWGPPVRVFAPPEITVIDLVPGGQ